MSLEIKAHWEFIEEVLTVLVHRYTVGAVGEVERGG